MRWPSWRPWPRRRRPSPQVQQATEKIKEATVDREKAVEVLKEAKEISAWARKASLENRFDMRLRAAYRIEASHPPRPDDR